MGQTKEYSPLNKENQTKINKKWAEYRQSIGLEGEILYDLVRKGLSITEANETISKSSQNRRELIEIWKNT